MSGLAYFFKPKITAADSSSSSGTEKRPGRRSKVSKSAEIVEKPVPAVTIEEQPVVAAEEQQPPAAVEPSPIPTPKIKLKFNLRSQSVQDTSDDRVLTTVQIDQPSQLSDNDDEQSSDSDARLKIDETEIPMVESTPMPIVSPTKKKGNSSSRKKVLSHLIGTSSNTLTLDEPSPIKLVPNDMHLSEVKQTKSGRTIKYTPYFKELVQGVSVSPPSSPSHSTTLAKRSSNSSKKKQSSIKADLDAIKNASLAMTSPTKGKKNAAGSPRTKKQAASPVKRLAQGKKSTTPKTTPSAGKSKRVVSEPVAPVTTADEDEDAEEEEEMESEEDNELSQRRSDDEEFRGDEHLSEAEEDEEDDEEELDDDDDQSAGGAASDEEEWTSNSTKFDSDRSLSLPRTLGSISSEMLDGYSLWAMKYRARHRSMALDDKRLYRTWKKMSAHDRQRWRLKAEKENFHYPIAAELLKATSNASVAESSSTTTKSSKTNKRKKGSNDPPPILLQKALNQYSKQQPAFAPSRPSSTFVKQPIVPPVNAPPKNYDILDIAAGVYLLGESLTKMGEKVRQLGHLNPRGASAATSIDSLTAILFDGTLCACNLMACLGNEITTTNPTTNRSDPLTNKLMENLGILLPGLN